jgi:hypothetical protein
MHRPYHPAHRAVQRNDFDGRKGARRVAANVDFGFAVHNYFLTSNTPIFIGLHALPTGRHLDNPSGLDYN